MLNETEIHQLAMKEVGDHLHQEGYDFLAVNSQLKKDPQFVCLKDQKLHFVVVRGCLYPWAQDIFYLVGKKLFSERPFVIFWT